MGTRSKKKRCKSHVRADSAIGLLTAPGFGLTVRRGWRRHSKSSALRSGFKRDVPEQILARGDACATTVPAAAPFMTVAREASHPTAWRSP